jgi:hypothetical protein
VPIIFLFNHLTASVTFPLWIYSFAGLFHCKTKRKSADWLGLKLLVTSTRLAILMKVVLQSGAIAPGKAFSTLRQHIVVKSWRTSQGLPLELRTSRIREPAGPSGGFQRRR